MDLQSEVFSWLFEGNGMEWDAVGWDGMEQMRFG